MENSGEWEKMKSAMNELMREGRECAQQLKFQLNSSSSSSQETREVLANKILDSYQKSLTIMTSGESLQDSPHCHAAGSPNCQDSDQDHQVKSSEKAMPRWKHKVKITPGAQYERTLDDGFSWRKYGQKSILGAKFPRGYYRCTHRHSKGCLATKQVQRCDDDSMLFDVIYRGTHTCSQAANQERNHISQDLKHLCITKELETDHINNHHHHFPSSSNANNNAYTFFHLTDNIGLHEVGYPNQDNYNFPMYHDDDISEI